MQRKPVSSASDAFAPAARRLTRCIAANRLSADSAEKHPFAGAEYCQLSVARAPFVSGVSRLLQSRKDLGQFAEVLGGGGEEKFVICAARPA